MITRLKKKTIYREVSSALRALYYQQPERIKRCSEDLCIVLSLPVFHPHLPRYFPGISGRETVAFTATYRIPRGDPFAMREAIISMSMNHLCGNPGKDIIEIVDHILTSAVDLCEGVPDAEGNRKPIVSYSMSVIDFTDEVQRISLLNTIIGNGRTRIVVGRVNENIFPATSVTSSQSSPSLRSDDPRNISKTKRFFQCLSKGGTVTDAIISTGILGEGMADAKAGLMSVADRLSEWGIKAEKRANENMRRRKAERLRRIRRSESR